MTIRAKVSAVSAQRDDALRFLYNELAADAWREWKRASDITLTQRRQQFKAPTWVAATTMIRDEDQR